MLIIGSYPLLIVSNLSLSIISFIVKVACTLFSRLSFFFAFDFSLLNYPMTWIAGKMEVLWGRKGYNQVLAPFGTKGSTINFVLISKARAGQCTTDQWRSPKAIIFNGDRCVSPLPTRY